MDNKKTFWGYFIQSLTGAGSLILAIVFFFILYNLGRFFTGVGIMIDILMPLFYGMVIAFVLGPLCEWFERGIGGLLPPAKREDRRQTLLCALGVFCSEILALAVVIILLVLVLPQLFSSIVSLVNSVPAASARLTAWVQRRLDNPDMQSQILSAYNTASSMALDWVQNTFLPRFQELLNNLSSGVFGFVSVLKNLVIGIIISVYLLYNRRLYLAQIKKFMYSLLPVKQANSLLFLLREMRDVFSGFLTGKLLDSLIIGMLCFVCMTIFRFPYPILISTIVGATNIIPYFGPFIGAIPGTILVLTVSYWQALYFVLFILILQQVDGNIIGPRILGSTTGLSSFWVLISLLLFGGLFGVPGMVIGVPVFAVLYDLVSRGVRWLLQQKNLPESSAYYEKLDHVDLQTGKMIEISEVPVETRREKQAEKKRERLQLLEELRRAGRERFKP